MNSYWPPLSIIGISLFVILIAVKALITQKKIAMNGLEADGVIFELSQPGNANENSVYPIVRFVTNTQIWITEKSKTGVVPGVYKIGKKVKVIYNKDSPEDFFINDSFRYTVPIIMIIGSIAILSFASYKLIQM